MPDEEVDGLVREPASEMAELGLPPERVNYELEGHRDFGTDPLPALACRNQNCLVGSADLHK
jgi:hypothetical protein